MFLFKDVTEDQRQQALAKLRWLRTRVHISMQHDSSERWYKLYCATDRLDPAPGIVFGTAGWEYMRFLAQKGDFSRADEATCCAIAHLYLGISP